MQQERDGAEGATKRRAPAALADGSPSASHRDKREHALHPSSSPMGASLGAAGAGGQALHVVERADAGSAGADEEGRRRARAPSMPAIVCADAHNPGGGAPQVAAVSGWVSASHAESTQGSSGPPPHVECAAAHQPHPEQLIAHMRAHEYPHFMRHHAQRGISAQEAHAMYMQYEQVRISQVTGGGARAHEAAGG